MVVLSLYLMLTCLSIGVKSFSSSDVTQLIDKKFEALLDRIKVLEDKDAFNTNQMASMVDNFMEREQTLLEKISRLERKHNTDVATLNGVKYSGTEKDNDETFVNNVTRRSGRQSQLAFFAVGPEFDFSRMGTGQKITYAPATTNIGNAFHSSSGEFVAPVKGTYVFFATICGKLQTTNNFNIEHNGVIKAKLFIGPVLEQSSQTVIVSMLPGDIVAVKSGRPNNGVYGSTYTSISGFLLY